MNPTDSSPSFNIYFLPFLSKFCILRKKKLLKEEEKPETSNIFWI